MFIKKSFFFETPNNIVKFIFLLPQALQADIGLPILLHDLGNCHFKVFLSNMYTSFSQSKHSRFRTDSLAFRATRIWHFLGNDLEVNVSQQIHFSGMDFHNCHSIFNVGVREFDLAINTSWPEQSCIENINAIRCHDDLDILCWFEAIQLIQKLQHGSLHFRVSTTSTFPASARASNGIDFIHKNDRGSSFSCHDKEFADHTTSLSNVLLDEFSS
mmetsp:Transcript_15692/g.29183  ORF Transcript_15692/g.29183 Transcript_15692/m.29183 type:complete len:215 (-) Transcript_15692:544-1188(-)